MNSQTFSSIERNGQPSLTATAAAIVLGSIAVLPPLAYNNIVAKPDYAIAARQLTSGGIMNTVNKKVSTHTSFDSDQVPSYFKEMTTPESFATPLLQGLQFIQKMAFIEPDDTIDNELNVHFSKRSVPTIKLFVNPYNKKV